MVDVVNELDQGLFEANLGGGIFKKRIRLANRGKRGGGRVIIAFKQHEIVFFIFGYAKNEMTTLTKKEERALKKYASDLFLMDQKCIKTLVKDKILFEVKP